MKKLFTGISIFIGALILLMVVLPIIFKNDISELVMQKANQSVNASIDYEEYQLSLFKSFPDFTATFSGVSVVGKGKFQGDTLAALNQISAKIDLRSILTNEGILLKSIELNGGVLQLLVNEDGYANWDIESEKIPQLKAEENSKAESSRVKDSKPLKLLLQNVGIRDFDFIYRDAESNYEFSMLKTRGQLSGELEGMNSILDVDVETESINFNYQNTNYIQNGQIKFETKLMADLNRYDFVFVEGDTKLNQLPIKVDGGFSMPNDSMVFKLQFDVPDIEMNQVLELIPDAYQKYMSNIETSANINFNGAIEGIYYDTIYPQIDVDFNLANGKLKHPDLPEELTIHSLHAQISKAQGELDLLQVGITNLSMQMAQNPFTMHAKFSSLMSDPHMDVALDGIIDMGSLSKVIPLGDTKMSGLMLADAAVLGNYSALENNDFSTFISRGSVNLSNFFLQNSTVPQGIHIKDAALVLQNQNVIVKGLKGNIGRSDFELKGKVKQLITYLFANDELQGQFELKSNTIDANEFLKRAPESKNQEAVYLEVDSAKVDDSPIVFPNNMHLRFKADIAFVLLDQMDITNFNGQLELKNQQLSLNGLSMNMIDGQLKMDGTVLADGRKHPDVNFDLNVLSFDLPTAYTDLSMVQKYMPFAAKSQGEFSTRLTVKSKITKELKMILSTITAKGLISTKNVSLMDASFLTGLNSVLQTNRIKNLTVDDFTARYSIENGNLKISPFQTKLANQPVALHGIYNLGGTLDFRVDATLDKVLLSGDIQNMIAYIPGHQKVTKIDVGLDISGPAKKPDVKVDTDKIKKQVVDQLKNSSKEDLEDAAKKLLRGLFK